MSNSSSNSLLKALTAYLREQDQRKEELKICEDLGVELKSPNPNKPPSSSFHVQFKLRTFKPTNCSYFPSSSPINS